MLPPVMKEKHRSNLKVFPITAANYLDLLPQTKTQKNEQAKAALTVESRKKENKEKEGRKGGREGGKGLSLVQFVPSLYMHISNHLYASQSS